MTTLQQISEVQWDQLQAFVGKATGVAAYISRKLAVLQWAALVSGLVLGLVIYQKAALSP